VQYSNDLAAVSSKADFLICGVPSYAVREVCGKLVSLWQNGNGPIFVSCCKGIEENTLMLPSQIFADVIGVESASRFAVLAGPSHAEEVCRGIPTLVTCSSPDLETASKVRDLFFQPQFRVYTQGDCVGVELGGALKNVIAIAAGGCDGMGFGDNTKAALITRGVAEIGRMAQALGARAKTLAGLAGLGDLIVTASSRHSRNRRFGELLAKGLTPEAALAEIGAAVEGYRTARSAYQLAAQIGVDMPLVTAVYSVVYEGLPMREVLKRLLERDPRPEDD